VKKKKKSTSRIYSVIFEGENPEQDEMILTLAYNPSFIRPLMTALLWLIAFEVVKDDPEYQSRFRVIMGKRLHFAAVERLVVGYFVSNLADSLVAKEKDALYEIQGFAEPFADKLTYPFKEEDETSERIMALFKELDTIATAKIKLIEAELRRKLRSAIGFINQTITVRLRAMLIQLLAESLLSTFEKPSVKDFQAIEDGCSTAIKIFLQESQKRGPVGRPSGSGWVNDENKWEVLEEVIKFGRKYYKDEGILPSQAKLAEYLNRFRVRHFSNRKEIQRLLRMCGKDWQADILPIIEQTT
jgi:hypothetical protein